MKVKHPAVAHDRVLDFHPANASITLLDVEDGRLRLIERGADMKTVVN